VNDELLTIFIPNNEAEHLIIKSLLENQGILTWSRNEHVQNLFGMGQLGTGYNYITGPVEIQINSKDLVKAENILSEYYNKKEVSDDINLKIENDYLENDNSDSLDDEIKVKRYLSKSLLYNFLWLFGIGSVFGLYYADMALITIRRSGKSGKEMAYAVFCFIFSIFGILLSVIFYKEWII
jgi:hypothetical protein